MLTPLIAQEVYFIERYISLDYYAEMRDAWSAMVDIAEQALDVFVHHLPADYRRRALPHQPDIVWGERVLANFRHTRDRVDEGFIQLTKGNMRALGRANGILNDATGFQRDYSSEWMSEPQIASVMPGAEDEFWKYLGEARARASQISHTLHVSWTGGDLTARYDPDSKGAVAFPESWPIYRTNPAIRAVTGEKPPQTGIYLPLLEDSAPNFLLAEWETFPAPVGYNPDTLQTITKKPCEWLLIERVADTGGTSGLELIPPPRYNVPAGQPCPEPGWWFTPAVGWSRRHFKAGDVMPDMENAYGDVYWQWHPVQEHDSE